MGIIFKSKEGMDVDEFLASHDVRGKNILYAISNRLASDRHRFKIGKANDGDSRLKSYRRSYGLKSRTDASSGARVHLVQVVPPRPEHAQGESLVTVKERAIKKFLGPPVRHRGSEFFEATLDKVVRAFEAAPKSIVYKDRRAADRIPICPKACRRRPDGSKTRVED